MAFGFLPVWMKPNHRHTQPAPGLSPHYPSPHLFQPIPTMSYLPMPQTTPQFVPVGLCQGCGSRPQYIETNGRVHDYCGRTCRDKYKHKRTQSQVQGMPLCLGCGLRPQNILEGYPHCSRGCAKKYPLHSYYPCAHGTCNAKTLIDGQFCAVHSKGVRLSLRTNDPRSTLSGPMSAQPDKAPRAPALRKFSKSNPIPESGSSLQRPKPILFYDKHEPYYEFTNFSNHPFRYNGHQYKTSEHLFQALKFVDTRPDIAKQIRGASSPRDVFNIAQSNRQYQRPDWRHVSIAMMDIALLHKFQQHKELKDKLLATGNAELIENSPVDSFWGNGADKMGRNELGKALMRLREKFLRGEA